MATTTKKLERLTMIRAALIKCRKETMDADEWVTLHDMEQRIEEMIHEERKACGWSGVYEIVNGCAGDCLFEGDSEQCKIYTDIMLEQHPERCGNIKILPIY